MPAEDLTVGRRAEIIAAASELFEQVGYYSTSMDDIAATVGIKKPSLYHHVKSKGQIVAWIHNSLADDLLARLQRRINDGEDPQTVIFWVISDILHALHDRPGHLRVYFEHHREIPDEYRADAQRKRDAYSQLVSQVIASGVRRGAFRTDHVSLTTLALFGMCNWAYQWYRTDGSLSVDQIAAHFWRQFLNGISITHELDAAVPSDAVN